MIPRPVSPEEEQYMRTRLAVYRARLAELEAQCERLEDQIEDLELALDPDVRQGLQGLIDEAMEHDR